MSRRLLSLSLVAALTLMNLQSAELHMHAGIGSDDHRHGPAFHHHDAVDHHLAQTTEIGAVNADDTVVHVALAAASAHSMQQLYADVEAPVCKAAVPSMVDALRIVARAHGPPSNPQHPLRAPPFAPSL